MKKIFGFLLTIGLVFSFIGEAFGQNVTMPAGSKVRYAIELKKMTKAEADAAVSTGYVDLWVYAYFNQAFVDEGFIVLNSSGDISRINVRFAANTQGYQIVYKDGTNDLRPDNDPTNCVAAFPGKAQQDAVTYDEDEESAVGSLGFRNCFGSCTGASLDGPTSALTGTAARLLAKKVTIDGETWYARALYKLRIKYNKSQSFYVEHRFDDQPSNSCGLATSNFNIRPDGSNNIYAPYPDGCNGNPDWSYTHADNPAGTSCMKMPGVFEVIRGGVEVMADPEFALAAGATCGGSDLQGTFKVANWNGKDWSNYTNVKMYVNTDGGNRKDITAQTAVTPSLPLNTSSTAADFNYTLASSAYMMNGAPADSLIWAFEEEKSTLI